MADKQIKVAKPDKAKPQPVKPHTTKPISVKPAKAHCVRCAKEITEALKGVRALCFTCDLALQSMHWEGEYSLYNRVVYMDGAEVNWFRDNGYGSVLRKPTQPRHNVSRFHRNKAMIG